MLTLSPFTTGRRPAIANATAAIKKSVEIFMPSILCAIAGSSSASYQTEMNTHRSYIIREGPIVSHLL